MDGKVVAVKRIKVNHITFPIAAKRNAKAKCCSMSAIPTHMNIVRFYGASWDEAPNAAS